MSGYDKVRRCSWSNWYDDVVTIYKIFVRVYLSTINAPLCANHRKGPGTKTGPFPTPKDASRYDNPVRLYGFTSGPKIFRANPTPKTASGYDVLGF